MKRDELGLVPDVYPLGFHDPEEAVFKTKKGLSRQIVKEISWLKNEPFWMRQFRLKSLEHFQRRPLPTWGGDLSGVHFDDLYYYLRPIEKKAASWQELPKKIRQTYVRLGLPEAEKKFLAGISSQYDSEVVYGSLKKRLIEKGVIFLDMDSGLRDYPDLVKKYFGTIIPPNDNKFAALNSAVWSGGSFIFVPKNVRVDLPLQAYFRINAAKMGQFERTLIIAEEGSYVHYVEGCFTKGTLIMANPDSKPIEDIKVGDKVLTHTGQYKGVYRTQTRSYTGSLYTIEFYGDSTQKLEVTEEHPFLTVRRQRKNDRNRLFEPRWRQAGRLNRMDYLVMPINRAVESLPDYGFEIPKTGSRKKPAEVVTKMVKSSPEFFRLVGYYLAEGSISSGHYLNFSFGAQEQKWIEDVKRLLKDIFGVEKCLESYHKTNNGISVVVCLTKLARVFAQFGTSSATKRVPQGMMFEDTQKQKELIIGLFRGDGNYYNKRHLSGRKELFRINTTSPILARQARDLLLRLGIVAFLNKRERENVGGGAMYTVGVSGEFMVPFGELVGISVKPTINRHKRATLFAIDDKYAYFPIKEIRKRYGEKVPVYNFSVEGNESYVAGGMAVHNCSAPIYTTNSLHAAVVEIIVKKGARVRYTTVQNWSPNVYNLVTKRMRVEEEGIGEWIDCNLGSCLTMKYPSLFLTGRGARGEVLSIAYAGRGQHQDAGGKAIHLAPDTSSKITSKSVSRGGGRTSYRGLVQVVPGAVKVRSKVVCNALILDEASRSDTYPTMKVDEQDVQIEHEATVSKIGEDQLFYLMSRGLSQEEAEAMIVNGFIEPVVKELPLEYAVELNRLIELEMAGSVG